MPLKNESDSATPNRRKRAPANPSAPRRAAGAGRRVARTSGYEPVPFAHFALGRDGVIASANAAAGRLLKIERDALTGVRFASFVDSMDRPAFEHLLARVFATGTPQICDLVLAREAQSLQVVRFEAVPHPSGEVCDAWGFEKTEHWQATNALMRSEGELRVAYRRLAQAEENQLRAVTEILHDQVGRNLTALNINLGLLGKELASGALPEAAQRLQDAATLLQATGEKVRNLMANLYPPMLNHFGLCAALRWWGDEVSRLSSVPVRVHADDNTSRLPPASEIALFRIAQEALGNAVRHSGSRTIDVVLTDTPQSLHLAIIDHGAGFGLEADVDPDARPAWGLMQMRERALAVGAVLRVNSTPGSGTSVVVEMPKVHR